MAAPRLPPGWEWRPCKDGITGYLDGPWGHTTSRPISIARAERIAEVYEAERTRQPREDKDS